MKVIRSKIKKKRKETKRKETNKERKKPGNGTNKEIKKYKERQTQRNK